MTYEIRNNLLTPKEKRGIPLKEKRRDDKPNSVPGAGRASVIYLMQPTPRHRAGRPHLPVYLVLQPSGAYPDDVTAAGRELLPRVFTLTETRKSRFRRYFSVTLTKRLLPSALSAGRRPMLSGLSSPLSGGDGMSRLGPQR